jgi:hypothetical protein
MTFSHPHVRTSVSVCEAINLIARLEKSFHCSESEEYFMLEDGPFYGVLPALWFYVLIVMSLL